MSTEPHGAPQGLIPRETAGATGSQGQKGFSGCDSPALPPAGWTERGGGGVQPGSPTQCWAPPPFGELAEGRVSLPGSLAFF